MSNVTATYQVPACNIAGLLDRITKLNKRATKLNMPAITIQLSKPFIDDAKMVEYQKITITGETPVIKGWEFLAAVEYLPEGGEVVSAAKPNLEFPKCYRGRKPFCEHCETHKVKRYTFLLQNTETQEYMNVGRTCLQDFLGADMDGHVSSFSYLAALMDELRDEDSDYYEPSGGERFYGVRQILYVAAALVSEEGYFPTSDEENSTRNKVSEILITGKYPEAKPEYSILADTVFDWIMKFDAEGTNNDFVLNCQNLFNAEWVRAKMFGYVVGAMGFYVGAKKREDRLAAEKRDINNEYVGEIKKRYTMDLTLIKSTSFEGYYGTTWVYTFLDSDNHCFVWFASNRLTVEVEVAETPAAFATTENVAVEVNQTVKVKATVKDHNEYKGVKQTVVTRVAVQK